MRSARRWEKGWRYSVRARAAASAPYLLLARVGRHRDEVLTASTAVVIEGFPRSANTFAALAFQTAQARPVRIAHNLHSVAHMRAAVRRGVPTILLVRNPEDVILSETIREYPVPLNRVLRAYCRFHEALAPLVPWVAVGEFARVTTAFGAVIGDLNDRFGTSFRPFDHSPQAVALVIDLIEQRERRPDVQAVDAYLAGTMTLEEVVEFYGALDRVTARPEVPEASVPRPSAERARVKAQLRRDLDDPRLAEIRARAARAYRVIVERSASR